MLLFSFSVVSVNIFVTLILGTSIVLWCHSILNVLVMFITAVEAWHSGSYPNLKYTGMDLLHCRLNEAKVNQPVCISLAVCGMADDPCSLHQQFPIAAAAKDAHKPLCPSNHCKHLLDLH